MKLAPTIFIILLVVSGAWAQRRPAAKPTPSPAKQVSIQTAVTKDGRTVLLRSDGTWEYTNDPVAVPSPLPLPSPSPSAAPTPIIGEAAIKGLRRMANATEVGIAFAQYGERVIDTKSIVEEDLKDLPEASELKKEIRAAMEAYVDAGQAWNRMMRSRLSDPSLLPDADPWAMALKEKYDL